ncbi:MAG: DEAD/DEAH box helicase [Saprospiraceae bacterium]
MTFKELHLVEPILKALDDQGYTTPTPIQEQSIPILLRGKDLLGCAQTGTGKTAAFSIPILQNIFLDKERNIRNRKVKALIVTPTRELAIQIYDNFEAYAKYTNIKSTVIFGGVKQGKQTDALRRGVDVLVATPGRLLDLISQGFITLRDIDYLVLDEADQMLDMGFIHDIKKIIAKLPVRRQSLFFSATMPPAIVKLSRQILGEFDTVTIKPKQATAERVEQAIYFVTKRNKIKLLKHLIITKEVNSTLVFSRTKHGADKIVKLLRRDEIYAEAIHGNKSQNARQRALGNFKKGKTTVLVATDIAARGIDVSELELVVNYDLPNVPETYVHRIGRTGRASASGEAVSFCNMEERAYLKTIQKLIRQTIPVVEEHPFVDDGTEVEPPSSNQQWGGRRRNDNQRRNNNSGNKSNNRSGRKRW